MFFKKKIDVEDYCSGTLKALFSPERESVYEQLRQACADPALTTVDRKLYLDHIRAVVLELLVVAIVKTYGFDVAFNARLFVKSYLRDHGLSDVDSRRQVFNTAFASYPEGVSGIAWVFSKEPLIVSWEASSLLKLNEVTCPSCHRRYKTKGGRILFGRGDISVVEIPRRPR